MITKSKKEFKLENKGTIRSKRALNIAADLAYNYGEDVVVYDVRERYPFVSYYILATSASDRRLKALLQQAKESLYDNYKEIKHVEGKNNSNWFLIDCSDLVVNLFTREERERLKLDELYAYLPHKVVIQEEEPVYKRRKRETYGA